MSVCKKIIAFLILLTVSLHISAMEIDQLTDREKYQDKARDFTYTLNHYTNSLIIKAVDNFNMRFNGIRMNQREVHRLMAFEIYKLTAGAETDEIGTVIPTHINLLYAVGKSGLGPLQKWIQDDVNDHYWFQLNDNLYSDIYPDSLNKNYIVKVGGEFLGPDKIDHFFDQGYSYWVISDYGQSDRKAKEFGVETENTWYGLMAGGVFSYGDLRANWAGYQFYKYLFNGEKSHLLVSCDGLITIRRPFDWSEHIDWQYDELKNPSVYTKSNINIMTKFIQENFERYRETYLFLKSEGLFSFLDKRESFYLTENIMFDSNRFSDVRSLIQNL